jgi:hypothetical protein
MSAAELYLMLAPVVFALVALAYVWWFVRH